MRPQAATQSPTGRAARIFVEESSMTYQTVNPATGQVVETFAAISDRDLDQALATAHRAFETDWRRRSVADRAKVMAKAAAILRERIEEYTGILVLEVGKRAMEAQAEVDLAAGILEYYAERAEGFLKPKPVADVPNAEVHIDPIGVLLAIEPWNFPYYQVARVVGPQLMAGNTVLLKHAESVPQSALAFARLFEEAGAPDGVYTNIFATIDQVGRLIDDPRVRGVTLTGSERAGSSVAERAGRNLKKAVLELGGSDPLIVLEDAPLEWAIGSAMVGRLFNCGQCCVASKRIIVVGKERGQAFLDGFSQAMASLKAGDPADGETGIGPLSSERQLNLLVDQIHRAKDGGARVVVGGHRIDRAGFFLEPTVLTGLTPENPVYREELFGPVAQFFVVEDEAEAIRLANDTAYGLGASVFTADTARGARIAAQIDSGMVFVNRPFGTTPQLPFGGAKNSGFGRELSEAGIEEFVNKKLVHVDPVGTAPF
ncbi:NAD-dependent succinate-semialdehyde dehydrogenase [Methylobacterium brachythecii]|uniref:NAD-dependent succinate-semialdehyde dehydrogenase n=1 Tax=Methylobacterium brachythecii TaxID=1176177 RepID=UPI0027B9B5C0|nr:NAD-dependent succinate-semialdehyde dehydrogenase [Methylobacterium brachythecii]